MHRAAPALCPLSPRTALGLSQQRVPLTLPGLFSFPKGELTITSEMEELSNALFYDNVPESWTRYAYPSLLTLANWYADLLLRIRVSTVCVTARAGAAQDSPTSALLYW